ncbi:hypothetical protein BC827DRAFT_106343 [Russula dissimulans]|nr:hypothetical protein BC827DRAFT_106343 [Russula dissimulans]
MRLEKSALDWNAHVQSSGAVELASELEANTRSGGYLDKVEFLQRVGDRKDEALEANRAHKRRRGDDTVLLRYLSYAHIYCTSPGQLTGVCCDTLSLIAWFVNLTLWCCTSHARYSREPLW